MKFSTFFLSFLFFFFSIEAQKPLYICTSADSDYFPHLINLINSIHKFNYDELGEIAVFNLGFTDKQVDELNNIKKVSVHDVELTHPDQLKHFQVNNYGKRVRGWYAWKPVAIKQGLELFPHMLYIDAGLMILRSLEKLFEHIWKHGYLLTGCGHSIKWMTPQHVIKTFNLSSFERSWILDDSTEGCAGGFMGLTREMLDDFVLPIYNLSYDLAHFQDDGTTPNGFGTARHDQVLFSVQARLLGLKIPAWKNQARVDIGGKKVPCLCRDIVVRSNLVVNVSRFPEKIREYIRYKD